jgi:hypothetical protein
MSDENQKTYTEFKDLFSRHPEALSQKELTQLISIMQGSLDTLDRAFHKSNICLLFQVLMLVISLKLLSGSVLDYISTGVIISFIILVGYKSYSYYIPPSDREYLKYLKTLLPQNQ